ncbi:MAG TPA: sugar phosphate isomerase/epimerase family protein [Terriglobia bacterium]|nr:sugar phosphate isomerase/epimerase family protein [Terriglobia bacterium]
MGINSRRHFLQVSAAAAVAASVPMNRLRGLDAGMASPVPAPKPMRLGLIVGIGKNPEAAIKKVHDLGVPSCQVGGLGPESLTPEIVSRLRTALDKYGIEATSAVFGAPGPEVYDFYQGPETIGFVPRKYRAARIEFTKKVSDFAKQLGIPAIQGHCGFIPENPNNPLYKETVEALREVAGYAKQNGQNFRYETGQETPITMLRAIEDVGLDNQGINFDCGNLILYGKANPVDALDVIGKHVQGMHAKDGLYPTDPHKLGEEVAIGKGKADFPRMIEKLRALNYQGAVTIEREISGPQQLEDIRREKDYLEKLIG